MSLIASSCSGNANEEAQNNNQIDSPGKGINRSSPDIEFSLDRFSKTSKDSDKGLVDFRKVTNSEDGRESEVKSESPETKPASSSTTNQSESETLKPQIPLPIPPVVSQPSIPPQEPAFIPLALGATPIIVNISASQSGGIISFSSDIRCNVPTIYVVASYRFGNAAENSKLVSTETTLNCPASGQPVNYSGAMGSATVGAIYEVEIFVKNNSNGRALGAKTNDFSNGQSATCLVQRSPYC